MHELSVCQSLLAEVGRIAELNKARCVTRITVAVGPLSGVEVPLLERAYSVARMGTAAKEATLETEIVAIKVYCKACERESDASINRLLCANCDSWQVELRSGDELLLKSVELEMQSSEGNDLVEGCGPAETIPYAKET